MVRDYGRVYTAFWASEDVRSLTDDGRLLALYLLTSPHTTIVGAFRLPDGYACEDLQWSTSRVNKGFDELLSKGFANRCETTKWAWIRKFLDWNAPENPNQWKAARKIVAQIPDECVWKADFFRVFARSAGDPEPSEPERSPNGSETLSKPGTGTEAGIGTGSGDSLSGISRPRKAQTRERPPYEEPEFHHSVLAAYHEVLPDLPTVKDWTKQRASALNARIRERLKAAKPADTVDYWRKLFASVAASDFLTGRSSDFRASIDWLLGPQNFQKVIEGNYANRVSHAA